MQAQVPTCVPVCGSACVRTCARMSVSCNNEQESTLTHAGGRCTNAVFSSENNEGTRVYGASDWVSLCLSVCEMCWDPLNPKKKSRFDGRCLGLCCIVQRLYGRVWASSVQWDKEFKGGQRVMNKNSLCIPFTELNLGLERVRDHCKAQGRPGSGPACGGSSSRLMG